MKYDEYKIPDVDLTDFDGVHKNNVNTTRVELGILELYFSYTTLIAFRIVGKPLVVCENVWSHTTAGHINKLEPNKDKRIPYEDFKHRVEHILQGIDRGLEDRIV